eukprot:9312792-Heterocapsa_arctica.AAC.1
MRSVNRPGIPDTRRWEQPWHVLSYEEAPPIEALSFHVPSGLIAVGVPLGRVAGGGRLSGYDANELVRAHQTCADVFEGHFGVASWVPVIGGGHAFRVVAEALRSVGAALVALRVLLRALRGCLLQFPRAACFWLHPCHVSGISGARAVRAVLALPAAVPGGAR